MCLAASREQLLSRMNLRSSDLVRFEQDFGALLSSCNFQIASTLHHEFASRFYHSVHHRVVVARIMVKQKERLNFRLHRERNGTRDRTVSPADVLGVFLIGVLAIEN